MVSQLIFGDFIQILETSENGKWKRIRGAFDGYEGWIDKRQFVPVEKSTYERASSQVMPFCSSFFGLIKSETMVYPVFMGSRLPFLRNNIIELGDQYYIFEGEYALPMPYDPIKMEVASLIYGVVNRILVLIVQVLFSRSFVIFISIFPEMLGNRS
jgi:hypothetical protein